MSKHNKTFYKNSALIKAEYLRILKIEKRMPSQLEVAKNVGLTQTSVSMHLNSVNFDEIAGTYKLFTADVLNALLDRAKEGDVPAIKFFLFLTHGVTEEFKIKAEEIKKVDINVKINPAIAKRVGDILAEEAEFEIINKKNVKQIEEKTKE